jgi:alkylated DNA repair dioxygenase AlkB
MDNQLKVDLYNNDKEGKFVESKNLKIKYFENFFSQEESYLYFNEILEKTPWNDPTSISWGRNTPYKRGVAWHGDEGKVYKYSGITVKPFPWNDLLIKIKSKIEEAFPTSYNSVLINDYKTGEIGMGWHSDDEKELGKNPVIGSVSFGAERDFYLKHKYEKDLNEKFLLSNGSLIIMYGSTQHYWQHHIPVRKKINERRINLTFRKIVF